MVGTCAAVDSGRTGDSPGRKVSGAGVTRVQFVESRSGAVV
jgi:hypothetical protein